MTVEQFCDKYNACKEGRDWALASCSTMQKVWDTARPEWLIWIAVQPDVLTDKELRLFAVFAARQVQHLMADPRSIAALDVAERFANGEASIEELEAAYAAANAAKWAAAYATRATGYTAIVAAKAAANAATIAAADAAAYAADAATIAAAEEAAEANETTQRAAAREAQATWLRKNTTPNFL